MDKSFKSKALKALEAKPDMALKAGSTNSNALLSLKVNEIFFSIQGESTAAGLPTIFIRLSGCPLRCSWCDTEYAFYEGSKDSVTSILDKIKKYPCKLVELTGGEPLAQPNSIPLMQALVDNGYDVMIETSGALPINQIPQEVKIVMDLKAPGSGEVSKNYWDNMGYLKPGVDELKFVVKNKEDFDFAVETERKYKAASKYTCLLSPVWGELENDQLAKWLLEEAPQFRMQSQFHKEIWGKDKRGV